MSALFSCVGVIMTIVDRVRIEVKHRCEVTYLFHPDSDYRLILCCIYCSGCIEIVVYNIVVGVLRL